MAVHIGWMEILTRLVLTLLAGALIGLNRGEHDRPAGLRTTLLVCLAASVSMIQMNLLLDLNGKTPSSFAVMDLMRLPLGILTGVGFIGAGSILKKGDLIKGVTTAATLWYVTVVGLCLGGGQLALGSVAAILGWFILTALKSWERQWHRGHRGVLTLVCDESGLNDEEIRRKVESLGGKVLHWVRLERRRSEGQRRCQCEIEWKGASDSSRLPPFADHFGNTPGVQKVAWDARS